MKSKRERIIAAGRELFLKNGIQATSMEQIAEAVPVSKMTIYNYFQSKEGLLEQVVQQMTDEIFAKFRETMDQAKDLVDAFDILMHDETSLAITELFVRDLSEYPEQIKKLMNYSQEIVIPELERFIFKGQQTGVVRKDISPHVLLLFLMGLKDFLMRRDAMKSVSDINFLREQVLSIVYYGILSPERQNQ